ncbi:N-acetylglucosaminyl-phosphatidylinositol de-N-acetylase, partial [Kappamyces sp. JEL0680]
ICTFDDYGVSGHANHRAVFHAVQEAKHSLALSIPAYRLRSTSVLAKYSSLPGALYFHLSNMAVQDGPISLLSDPTDYYYGVSAMFQHKSQLVWFRYIYLAMSTFMIYNELEEIQ